MKLLNSVNIKIAPDRCSRRTGLFVFVTPAGTATTAATAAAVMAALLLLAVVPALVALAAVPLAEVELEAEFNYSAGQSFLKNSLYPEAIIHFRRAAEAGDRIEDWLALATALVLADEPRLAEQLLTTLDDPNLAVELKRRRLQLMGFAAWRAGNYYGAAAWLSSALTLRGRTLLDGEASSGSPSGSPSGSTNADVPGRRLDATVEIELFPREIETVIVAADALIRIGRKDDALALLGGVYRRQLNSLRGRDWQRAHSRFRWPSTGGDQLDSPGQTVEPVSTDIRWRRLVFFHCRQLVMAGFEAAALKIIELEFPLSGRLYFEAEIFRAQLEQAVGRVGAAGQTLHRLSQRTRPFWELGDSGLRTSPELDFTLDPPRRDRRNLPFWLDFLLLDLDSPDLPPLSAERAELRRNADRRLYIRYLKFAANFSESGGLDLNSNPGGIIGNWLLMDQISEFEAVLAPFKFQPGRIVFE